jgi:hypothetical protein
VSIDGYAAFTGEGKGVVHVLIADESLEPLREAFSNAGLGVADEREVARRLADGNVNIDLAYTTFGGVRVVFSTDDVRLAREHSKADGLRRTSTDSAVLSNAHSAPATQVPSGRP